MEGFWPIFFLAVVLKIPVGLLLYLVYWAVKQSDAPAEAPGELTMIEGMMHCISLPAGERLRRLSEHYDLIWATGWEERADEYLPTLLGLPRGLPVLTFAGRARFGTAHWKVDAIDEYAGSRPLAWVDDNLDETCERWAADREAPTLLVPTESDRGLEEAHVGALVDWVESGFEPG